MVCEYASSRHIAPEVDVIPILGSPRLAREAARPLQEPSRDVWRRRSCRYVKLLLGVARTIEREQYIRSKRNNAQRRFRDRAASGCGGLGKRQLYVDKEPTNPSLLLMACI